MFNQFAIKLLRLLSVVAVLTLPRLGRAQEAARPPAVAWALRELAARPTPLGLSEQDRADPLVTDVYTDAHNGVSHVYLRQRHRGLEVVGAELSLHFDRQGRLLHQSGSFVSRLAAAVPSTAPALTAGAAVSAAARPLGLMARNLRAVTAARPGAGANSATFVTLRDEALSRAEIPVQLILLRQDDGTVRLAWDLELAPPGTTHRWHSQVDATTGQVLRRTNRIIHERVAPRAGAATTAPASAGATAHRGAADGASYNVFAFPLEGPGFGPRTLLTNPADPLASPYGWHDTNGRDGAEHTITRGNNVYAYTGPEARPQYSPQGTASLRFDFPYDITRAPFGNRDAAITNLFYLNNVMHDVTFQYGFNEASGNFQETNYTGQGRGRDAVLAVAEDPDDTDQAYFSPGYDGDSSSMHMFLWPQPFRLRFEVAGPASIAGTYPAVEGTVGPPFPLTPFMGRLVVVNDASAAPTAACATEGLTNEAEIRGNIAVIDRGGCNFSVKILNAQKAGAVAVVMVNNVAGAPFVMGGTPDGITIPALMVSLADGNRLKAALAAGSPVSVAVQRLAPLAADRDGSFDNGIVAHEYTHGISTRLTGGPSHRSSCLPVDNGKETDDPAYIPYETMGEGWSDFFALWFTTRPGDTGATPRAVGTYVLAQASNGVGIRTKPYSTDFSVNNLTYEAIGKDKFTETHDVGEVWAAVLWDLNWAMIARYGYDPDLYHGQGGNNKTMQLVMDGLKLQPCRPGFTDGRDAILAADKADFGGVNRAIIWRAFARRGLGDDAVQGTVSALDNQAGFALPQGIDPLAEPGVELYPNPTQDEETVTVRAYDPRLAATADVEISLTSVLGQRVRTVHVPADELRLGYFLNVRQLRNGIYVLRVQASTGTIGTRKLTVNH
ncbi:M36 family metallopeptidase [uncultured Hymenobacter sp.]|uniref:M36 family metallopeptidase n=1 Tax=uncultured Hymenobacter sp. TaxID=170016 RepID=UPI0035CA77DA